MKKRLNLDEAVFLTSDILALPLGDHGTDGLVLLHLVLLEPSLAGRLVVGLAHLAN